MRGFLMHRVKDVSDNRLLFLDNLRYFLVLCVVMEHAGNAYVNLTWWPVADKSVSLVVQFFSALFDAFNMPLLFYIAGYFAIPTIRKKGTADFLKGKLRRLGIPWLVCIITICPVLPLIYHYTRNFFILTTGYWDLWVELMKNTLQFNIGIVPSMDELMIDNQFYQRYMWFLSLLILFFFVFALCYILRKRWFDAPKKPLEPVIPTTWSSMKLLLIIACSTTVFSFTSIGLMMALDPKLSSPEPLFTLGNIIQFRPSRVFFFIIYFVLGILTYRNKWIEQGKFPGHFKTWMFSFIFLLIPFLYAKYLMLHGPRDLDELFGVIFFLLLNFLTISALGFFTSLALKYRNRPSAFDRSLASNSYNIYLSHYIFIIALQLVLLLFHGIPGLVKCGIVSLLAVIFSYAVSRFLITPFPRISITAAAGLLVIMALVIRP